MEDGMWTTVRTGLLLLGLLACSPAAANEQWDMHPPRRTLVAGTLIQATTQDSLSSRRDMTGENVTALVSGDVEDVHGHVVIPAGSRVVLRIAQVETASNKRQHDARMALDVTSLTVRGREYPVRIRVVSTLIHRASRDVVVPPGTAILFVLPQPLTVVTR
jgi:hypothetical protein